MLMGFYVLKFFYYIITNFFPCYYELAVGTNGQRDWHYRLLHKCNRFGLECRKAFLKGRRISEVFFSHFYYSLTEHKSSSLNSRNSCHIGVGIEI